MSIIESGKKSFIERSQFDVPIEEIGLDDVPTLLLDSSLKEALEVMQKEKYGALCVVKEGATMGMLTESDILLKVNFDEEGWLETPCRNIMTPGPFTLPMSGTVSDAIKLIGRKNFRHVPLVDEQGSYKTLLSIKDIIGYLCQFFPEQVGKFGVITEWDYRTVDDYSEGFSSSHQSPELVSGNIFLAHLKRVCHKRPLTLDVKSPILEVIELMREQKRGAVLLMEFETNIKGVLTERDLLLKVFGKHSDISNLAVKDFMTPNPHVLLSKHYIAHAINNMFKFNYRNTIVVNEDAYPLALVSLLDVFKFIAFHFYGDEISLLRKDEV